MTDLQCLPTRVALFPLPASITAVFLLLSGNSINDLTHYSFILSPILCENLHYFVNKDIHSYSIFIYGLFSILSN